MRLLVSIDIRTVPNLCPTAADEGGELAATDPELAFLKPPTSVLADKCKR